MLAFNSSIFAKLELRMFKESAWGALKTGPKIDPRVWQSLSEI